MKILLTMNLPYFPAHGGANKANRFLCEGLAQRGHSVITVVPAFGIPGRLTRTQLLDELSLLGVSVETEADAEVFRLNGVEVHAVVDPSQIRAHLLRQIENSRPDLVLVSSEDPSQNLLSAALKACPGRVIFLAHSMSFLPFGPWSFFSSSVRAKLLEQTTAIVAVGHFVAEYIRRWSGLEATVIHWPAYGSGPFPSLGSFDNDFVTMVNPCAVKGLNIFLALAQSLPDVKFAAVPTWGTTAEDKAALEEVPNITLLPATDNIDEIFARTRVLVVPSLWGEGFPLIVVESMLRGVPVVASNAGGTFEAKLGTNYTLPVRPVERFTDQLDGNMVPTAVIPEQEIGPWHDAVRSLVSNRLLYERQSNAAREASLEFVSNLDVTGFEDLFAHLAEQARSGCQSNAVHPQENKGESVSSSDRLTSKRLVDLSPEQRALLLMRLRKKAAHTKNAEGGARSANIRRAARGSTQPLSFGQQRLWFLDQMESGSPTYNVSGGLRLTGLLNLAALKQALNEIVRRHEILRTTFAAVEGVPVQVVAETGKVILAEADLRDLPDSEADSEARELSNEEGLRPFHLERGPLLRAKLLRLGRAEHVLLLSLHHIISDGWSLSVLARELTILYRAFALGEPSLLPELSIQYGDFAQWQQQWLKGDAFDKQLVYWRQHLAGAPPVMELPTDYPRPAIQTFKGKLQSFALNRDLSTALKELSRREGVTLFMTLLAAFQMLLQRYTGQDHCVVGTNIAGRNRGELEPLIGLFANNLVLHTDLSGKLTFLELLRRVRDVTLGAYAHQEFPFEKLVESVRPARDMSRSPLMQVLFVLQNIPRLDLELGDLSVSLLESDCRVAKFDLTLFMEEDDQNLRGNVEFNTDLFDGSTIVRMLDHFRNLLEEVAVNPARALSDYSITMHQPMTQAGDGGFNDELEAY